MICISNITVDSSNAAACVPYIMHLLAYIESTDKISTQRALVALHRTLMAPEAMTVIDGNEEIIDELLKSVYNLWESEHAQIIFGIIETLTRNPFACKKLDEKGVTQVVINKLKYSQINDPIRPKYIRIKSRLLASQK